MFIMNFFLTAMENVLWGINLLRSPIVVGLTPIVVAEQAQISYKVTSCWELLGSSKLNNLIRPPSIGVEKALQVRPSFGSRRPLC